MAKKGKAKDEVEDSSESKSGKRKKIEFNLEDGVSWHDFVGIFVLIGSFLWRILRLILAPVFWVYSENVRMFRFARTTSHERILTEDERWFVETIPFIYTLTGLVGGILVGLFAAFTFSDVLTQFFENLAQGLQGILKIIGAILGFFWDVIVWFFSGLFSIIIWLKDIIIGAFITDPFLALGGLLVIGVVVMLIYISIIETGVLDTVVDFLKKAFYWLIGSPERFRLRMNSYYRRMNHWLTLKLVGKERLHTRTQAYFKKVVFYTIFLSIYSFISGIVIGSNPGNTGGFDSLFQQVLFTATVLFMAGVISGTIFFALVARFLDLWNRRKYIAPQFIKGGDVDAEAIRKHTEDDEKRISDELKVPEEEEVATEEPAKSDTGEPEE